MKKALYIILGINLLRLILILFIDILPSESVYLFENHFSSKFIFPPLFIWITDTINIFFKESIIAIRLLNFVLSLLSQWSLYLLISKIVRHNRRYYSWVVISSTLSISYISMVSLSDSLLLLFWTLSILTLYNAIFKADKISWVLSGIFMGLTLLNKLSGLALPVGMFLFLIFSSRYREYLFKFGPYISLAIAAVISIPFLPTVIEIQNISLQLHQAEALSQFFSFEIKQYLGFVGFQLLLIFPVLYIGLWWVTFKYFGRIFKKPNQINSEFWFLLSFFLPLFVGFHLIALFSNVDYLGLIPVYISGMIVLLKLIKRRWILWSFAFSIIIHAVLIYRFF